MKAALQRIAKWIGEFPPSGFTWENGSPVSYGDAFGSNGERDYMRQVASEALKKIRHGSVLEPSEDRLYKTARTLLDLYSQHGPDKFEARFGTLKILDVCWQIVAEGEGNPHPWPGQNQRRSK
jgi:hypothetical protein